MATALAASMTCSTSPCVTSLSRTPTTPWELRLRTWLPAMPANTEWISQPAMSSASSTARRIDCTVDSMLTTTPFFSPREGWEPMPSISIEPSRPTSPTSATTFEVPMSRPTMRFLSDRLSIPTTAFFGAVCRAPPADRESVGVPHVHVRDIAAALSHEPQSRIDEFVEPFVDLPPPQPHGDAVGQIEFPCAARIQPHRRQTQTGLDEPTLRSQIPLRDHRLLALRPRESCQLGWHVALVLREQLATRIQQTAIAPARRGDLFNHQHAQSARPGALHTDGIDPGERMNRASHLTEIHTQQTRSAHVLLDYPLHVHRSYSLEPASHGHRLYGLIQSPGHHRGHRAHGPEIAKRHCERAPVDLRQLPLAFGLFAAVLAAQHVG